MEEFIGILHRVIFDGDGGYKIAVVIDEKTNEEKIITGYLSLLKGQKYLFTVEEKEHPKYGQQYQVQSYQMQIPTEEEGLIEFLSSKSFKNVGKRTAKKIVEQFQNETINIIKHNPEQLIELGIKENIVDTLHTTLNESDGLDDLFRLLQPLNFSEYYIYEIYKYTKTNNIISIDKFIKNNPYELIENIEGIGFEKIDSVFQYYNDNPNDELRIQSAIKYCINDYCYNSGDTYITEEELKNKLQQLLKIEINNFDEYIEQLIKDNKIIIKEEKIFLKEFLEAEKAIARNILSRIKILNLGLKEEIIEPNIHKFERKNKINYSEMQKKAIVNSLSNNISIITGGPGTGKTTIINAIVNIFREIKYKDKIVKDISEKIILCAPTGRASQRMKEATGYEAKTIHSLLEWDPYKNTFNRGIDNQLIQELIIIDEFSMVDIFLAKSIFQAIRPESLIVIVGDSAQLESVNPGNVLHDLLSYNDIPQIHLDVIFRQGEGSSIAKLAKEIEENAKIEIVNTKDMSVIERNNDLPLLIKSIVDKSYKAGYDEMEVQVLYPKYNGTNGIDKLNKVLLQNKDQQYIEYGENKFYVGDKVMQLKNNYDKNIYNGDIGKITQIYQNNSKKEDSFCMEIEFKDKKVNISRKELIDIKHAYAISIHKSQGSEFKVVIIPISKEAQNMMNKKLLYTAISRAKDKLILIGDMECFYDNLYKEGQERKTYLKQLLK